MAVDVTTELVIARPLDVVASYAADMSNAPEWYKNIESVVWETDPPLSQGSRMAFAARFLGRRLEYTYEVRTYVPGVQLVMSTAQGPFEMETTYTWTPVSEKATQMRLRNRGEPTGFSKLTAPLMASAIQRANQRDLERLRSILEARPV